MKNAEIEATAVADAPEPGGPDLLKRPAKLGILGGLPVPTGRGVALGTLVALTESGELRVDFPGNPFGQSLAAPTTVAVRQEDVGRNLVLQFIDADLRRPVVLGLLQDPGPAPTEAEAPRLDAGIDGERVTLTARREIVLRCGKASITLTAAGKVLIRGAYLLSRSTGANRIKGGSVQIN